MRRELDQASDGMCRCGAYVDEVHSPDCEDLHAQPAPILGVFARLQAFMDEAKARRAGEIQPVVSPPTSPTPES